MISTVLALMLGLVSSTTMLKHEESYYRRGFEKWMETYGISFHTHTEYERRFGIWAQADDLITTHNSQKSSFKMAHNAFSHLTHQEFLEDRAISNMTLRKAQNQMKSSFRGPRYVHEAPADVSSLADSVDWTTENAVTDVKDQGSCGGCWAFSTTGSIEGAYAIKYGELKSFSEQQLISCDSTDDGCDGGLMDNAFEWAKSNGGLCTEDDYPYSTSTYNGNTGTCKSTCSVVSGSAPSSYTDVRSTESALMSAVAKQPVAVAIEADQVAFQYYSSGVLTGACGTSLDHGVLAVGYGTYDGTDYWKVKNSWGSSWGMDGYVLIERGNDECGILMEASYPTL